jgi:hypothetical protein
MEEKRCTSCHEIKHYDQFNLRRAARDGRQDRCRDCCRAWYLRNCEEHKQRVALRNERTLRVYRQRLVEYFAEHPCVDCGETDLRVLEFDHREEDEKAAGVGALVTHLAAWSRVLAEIEKCDVRCANCHRRRTAERGGHWQHLFLIEASVQALLEERLRAC